jgi:hypothetical protein
MVDDENEHSRPPSPHLQMARTAENKTPAARKYSAIRVGQVRSALAGKRAGPAAIAALNLLAKSLGVELYTRMDEAHQSLGHAKDDAYYDTSVLPTMLLDRDLAFDAARVILPAGMHASVLSGAVVELMQKK